MREMLSLSFFSLFLLTGCGGGVSGPRFGNGTAIHGTVMSGQSPVAGAHVYLFAANDNGYKNPSISLLDGDKTGYTDSTGTYVLSGSDGNFTIPTYYSCSSSQQLYLYASGGDSGLGENSASGELTVLGGCASLEGLTSPVIVNEVTTVGAAYAMAGFATDALHVSSSGTPQAITGIANAFANASKLVSNTAGWALIVIPAGTATVPRSTINTLANILSSCVHSQGPGSASCATFLSSLPSGTSSIDTASAMIAIAHSPAANVAALFALQSSAPPFTPFLTSAPNDYTLGVTYTGGGMYGVDAMAIDSQGDIWVLSSNSIVEIGSSGAFLSGLNGYSANLLYPVGLAIDTQDNVWTANEARALSGTTAMIELSSAGKVLNGPNGYSGGGLSYVTQIAIDLSGTLWMSNGAAYTNGYNGSVTEMAPSGQFLSGPNGFTGGGLGYAVALSIEPSGDVWVANSSSFPITELSPAGQPLTGSSGLSGQGIFGGVASAIDSGGNLWMTTLSYANPPVAEITKLTSSGAVLSGPDGFVPGGVGNFRGGNDLAIDGDGNVWVSLYGSSTYGTVPGIAKISNSGNLLSEPDGFYNNILPNVASYLAIDASGDLWFNSYKSAAYPIDLTETVTEMIGVAAPVVTPLAAGVKNNTLGTRP